MLSLAGGMAGAYLLLWLNQAYLMILLALVVLWYAVTSLVGHPIVLKNTKTNMVIVGIFGGLVDGATSAIAPVMMMYLLSISDNKEPSSAWRICVSSWVRWRSSLCYSMH